MAKIEMSELQSCILEAAKKGPVTDEKFDQIFQILRRPRLSYQSLTAIIGNLNAIIKPKKLIATGSPPESERMPTYSLHLPPADD